MHCQNSSRGTLTCCRYQSKDGVSERSIIESRAEQKKAPSVVQYSTQESYWRSVQIVGTLRGSVLSTVLYSTGTLQAPVKKVLFGCASTKERPLQKVGTGGTPSHKRQVESGIFRLDSFEESFCAHSDNGHTRQAGRRCIIQNKKVGRENKASSERYCSGAYNCIS